MQKMKSILVIIYVLISSSLLNAQSDICKCLDGIGTVNGDEPSLVVEFANGQKLIVCGYEQQKISDNEILISEFDIFNCQTKKSLVQFGAVDLCRIVHKEDKVIINKLKKLPAGKNWEWINISIGVQELGEKNGDIYITQLVPNFKKLKIDSKLIEEFFQQVSFLKGKGYSNKFEEIIGKLEVLSLNGNSQAYSILMNFEEYFNFKPDGAIAEQWKDALATVNWTKK